jgi:hypothetical protein
VRRGGNLPHPGQAAGRRDLPIMGQLHADLVQDAVGTQRHRSVRPWAAATTTRESWRRAWHAPWRPPRRLPRVLPASQAGRRNAGQVSRRPAECPAPSLAATARRRAGRCSTCLSGLDAAALATAGAGCLGVVMVADLAHDGLGRSATEPITVTATVACDLRRRGLARRWAADPW